MENIEENRKKLINKRSEIKEQFLREEISAEEYNKLKNESEKEFEKLQDLEESSKENKELETKEEQREQEIKEEQEERLEKKENDLRYKHKIIPNTLNNKKGNIWKYTAIILSILFIASLVWGKSGVGSNYSNNAPKEAVDFINNNLLTNGGKASLVEFKEVSGLYKIKLDVNGQNIDSYVTKDGSLFFSQGFNTNEELNIQNNQNNNQPNQQNTEKIDVSIDNDPSIGPENAPIIIVEFSDFQCPFCAKAYPTVKQILDNYEGKVRFVYRDFPLSFHQYAEKAAEAAECANEQEKFWQYYDILFEKQSEWSSIGVTKFKEYAQNLSLNIQKFNECLDSGKYSNEVQKDFADGQSYGVSGTPAFFINGISISGAQPYSAFEQVIEQELNK